MIRTPTTFVLGAGASMAYGFPSGRDLAHKICESVSEQNTHMACIARGVTGCGATDPLDLAREFRASSLYSIDAFLQRRPEFATLGKALIAAVLIPCEHDSALQPSDWKDDWYRYLFNSIFPPTAAEFSENQLRIVTFNFDRSFERRLFLALRATYKLDADKAAELARTVEIVHVHGQLGSPNWLIEDGRPYGSATPVTPSPAESDVAACAGQIHLVSDELEDREPVRLARQFLRTAKTACFLGFGYHQINLGRLRVADAEFTPDKLVGTAFDVPNGERELIQRSFIGKRLSLRNRDWSIMTLLQEETVIHEP